MSRLNVVWTEALIVLTAVTALATAPLAAQRPADARHPEAQSQAAPRHAPKHVAADAHLDTGPLEHAELVAVHELAELEAPVEPPADLLLAERRLAAAEVAERELAPRPRVAPSRGFATEPPPPLQQGDSAEALYKLAREHLNQGDFRQAAALFRSLVDRYPQSKYAPDALYWQAYALYRRGGPERLRLALNALDDQQRRFPKAATSGDAESLRVRINGELARGGDSDAAEAIATQAAELAATAIDAVRPAIDAALAGAKPQIEQATRAAADEVNRAMRDASRAMRDASDAIAHVGDEDRLPPECADQQEKIEMRIAALNALLQMESEQAMPILRDVLKRRDVCSSPLRRKAVFLVAQKRTPETEGILLDLVRNDPDPRVREQAVFWLSQVPGEKSLKAIEEVLSTTSDRKIQERALFALSQHNSPEANVVLRRYAADEKVPSELRERAIFSLGQRHEQRENAEFLERLYKQTSDAELKEQILFALAQMGMQGADRFLVEVARDESQPISVRKQALVRLVQTGHISTAALAEMYESPIDKGLKETIIFALGQRPDGVDKLLDIARTEKNPGFRKKAIFWLGQSKDPRATKLLQEIINQ